MKEKLLNGQEKLSLVGLGYVGMPIAVAFANEGIKVVGFDLNKAKIELYIFSLSPKLEFIIRKKTSIVEEKTILIVFVIDNVIKH